MANPYFERHRETLNGALTAMRKRDYWTPFPESPSPRIWGETAAADGERAFRARLGKPFELGQPGTAGWVGPELSPFGIELGVTYPKAATELLVKAAQAAMPAWRKAGVEVRTGICLEILARIHKRSFELAHAVMHTTGQAYVMAFQAGGPHAQDRGLEAVATAYEEMTRTPERAHWEKPQGKAAPIRLVKTYRIMPRGVAVVVGVSTFPTWNGYPGLFASLVTGNAVIVKPHPAAILPLAISVEICREVLREAGQDPNLVTLAADSAAAPITKELVMRPEVAIVDFTGGSAFGDWLEQNCRHAVVFTEKAGVNSVVIDSTDDLAGMAGNLAFSLSLYSGQMCTTPQNIFISKNGITAGGRKLGFDDCANAIAAAVDKFLADPERAVDILGAIQSEATWQRVDGARRTGTVLLESRVLAHPKFSKARVRTPLILSVDAGAEAVYGQEMFGPIAYIVATDGTADSIARAAGLAKRRGAITAAVYSTDPAVMEAAEEAAAEAGVALSCNLTGGVFVNQSAAFSDYHATGANPAANASLTDAAFVASRFRVVQSRVQVAA